MTGDHPYAEVIGDPIAHSKSPLIHRHWLAALGIDADYHACHVTPDGLQAYIESRRNDPNWRGCNVTLPHKQAVIAHVDDPGGIERSIGAANTLFRSDGALICTNTDAAGFFAPIADVDLAGAPVVVVGTGGAARAVLFALAQVGVGPVTVLGRNVLKASALLAHFGLKGRALPLDAAVPPAALLVNASSLGMTGQAPLEINLAPLPADAIVYDLVYAPIETSLLAQARARGLETVDGLEMLISQAAVAFELFFGASPPDDPEGRLRARLLDA
jgi:shikimate dehydrogenase